MLTDRQPVNHQVESQKTQRSPDSDIIERSEIGQISNPVRVTNIISEEQCAQNIISVSEEQCAQRHTSVSNTTEIEVEIHAEESGVHFRDAQDQSECGSLTTQAPQSSSIRATINALSTWVSAVQPRESWYLAGWIKDSPIDFLVDPGAVVSTVSLQCYERLVETGPYTHP